jgi:GxxExxY protein
MHTDSKDGKHRALTEKIIGIFYKVYNTLGYGFLERIYENAILIELEKQGIPACAQYPIKVSYGGKVIGEYFTDILVDGKVIMEIKATRGLPFESEAQLLNYLNPNVADPFRGKTCKSASDVAAHRLG